MWTPPLAVQGRHVATQPLWWWGGWAHWIVFITSLCLYYAPCLVRIKHSVYHEPISVLINVFTLFASYLLSTLLVLILTMHEIRQWSFKAGMLPQSHCGDRGVAHWIVFMTSLCITLLALCLLINVSTLLL